MHAMQYFKMHIRYVFLYNRIIATKAVKKEK